VNKGLETIKPSFTLGLLELCHLFQRLKPQIVIHNSVDRRAAGDRLFDGVASFLEKRFIEHDFAFRPESGVSFSRREFRDLTVIIFFRTMT